MKDNPRHIYTVSQLTQDIKLILENTFEQVWVEGEVSNFKADAKGHFYFSLKDEGAVLPAAMFRQANKEVRFKIEDGLKAICFGRIDVYPPHGKYKLNIGKIEPKGIGSQQLAFEQLKKKLFQEGLFDPAHKRELPLMPFSVGIVTSASGAAVRDILQILKKGAACVDVLIRSVRVQGEFAAREVADGIAELNQFKNVDLIIVSRGGGSSEELMPFNEEAVARAVYNSAIPVISAVGHQINITLADMVADVFVETPSAAAKIIVDKKNSLLAELDGLKHQLAFAASAVIGRLNNTLVALRHMLKSPQDRLLERQQFLNRLNLDLSNNIRHYLNIVRERSAALIERLDALSPLAVLSRGYSLSMRLPEGEIIKDASQIKAGDKVSTTLSKGSFVSEVQQINKDQARPDQGGQ
ncbi:MAG: exodeoxyribonuclease VII large subunit [Candidatus Omnitrophica bacterium]|nr:exodeoxyribonuclease VII large subunit [Candidatus Omnitrophota bacterium]MBL7210184.1 exodeoxyribonuclease VII large subunit [Candidatus Omnitrophota bacterium]